MIYLASHSPRRRELLEQIQVHYQSLAITVDETRYAQEIPQKYVTRLALTKARTGRLVAPTNAPVLSADTIVVCQGQIFGKPLNEASAQQMLKQLSATNHQVMTAVAVVTTTQESVCLNISQVYFRSLSDQEIAAYIATQEQLDKAGGYAIQGIASIFIERIEGSYSGVMGLPLYETAKLLTTMGIKIL